MFALCVPSSISSHPKRSVAIEVLIPIAAACVSMCVCVCVCVYIHTHGDRMRYASIIYDTTHYRMTDAFINDMTPIVAAYSSIHTVACDVLVVLQSVSTR